jgi:hypothetical protein
VRLDELSGIEPATALEGSEQQVTVDTLRSAAEQMTVPLRPGTRVALGVRRVHALPTPISSFNLMTCSDGEAAQLERSPLLAQLVSSMQARVIRRGEQLEAGICVLPLDEQAPAAIAAAVAHGARRILCIPAGAGVPQRLLVHAGEAVRRADLLALVSSVMRHLPIEATAVTLQHPQASRSEVVETQRTLLDTRAELRGSHGLDLRSDRFVGDLPAWLESVVAQPEAALLVLGVDHAPDLATRLGSELPMLFRSGGHVDLLLAFGRAA